MTENITIQVTAHALETITAMSDELNRIRSLFGDSDPRTVKAATSLASSLTQMLALRPTAIYSDGEHSLICHAEHITFGVNYIGAGHNEHGVGDWSVNS